MKDVIWLGLHNPCGSGSFPRAIHCLSHQRLGWGGLRVGQGMQNPDLSMGARLCQEGRVDHTGPRGSDLCSLFPQ